MTYNCTLTAPEVQAVLTRLFRNAEHVDEAVLARVRSQLSTIQGEEQHRQRSEILGEAYLPVPPEVGRLLYVLTRATHSRTVVEFGTSFAISTIHLAAAVRDNGGGKVITTELNSRKVRQASANLREAGLLDFVEIREGDASETLKTVEGPVDLVLLDGWKDLYLPVLKVIEPRLRSGALVLADDLDITPEVHKPFLDYVRDPENGYISLDVPMGDRLELSLRLWGR